MTPVVGNIGMQPAVRIVLNAHERDQLTAFTLVYACFVVVIPSIWVVRDTPSRRPGHPAIFGYHKSHIAWISIASQEPIDGNSHAAVIQRYGGSPQTGR